MGLSIMNALYKVMSTLAVHISNGAKRLSAGVTFIMLRVVHHVLSRRCQDCILEHSQCMYHTDLEEKTEEEGMDELSC